MPDKYGNPESEEEARAILRGGAGRELLNAAANYVVPLLWNGEQGHSSEGGLHNGSGFFLHIDGPILFVTAAHVIRALEADRLSSGDQVKAQLMNAVFDPISSLIDIDDSLDIATARVPEGLPSKIHKWVYERALSMWPPDPPTQGRGLFFAGFPRILRSEPDPNTLMFGLYGGLLTATSVSESGIVCQLNRDHSEALVGLQGPPQNAWLGGLSGAPGWTLTQFGWRLAGILHEYSQEFELFYFSHANRIKSDGSLIRNGQ